MFGPEPNTCSISLDLEPLESVYKQAPVSQLET